VEALLDLERLTRQQVKENPQIAESTLEALAGNGGGSWRLILRRVLLLRKKSVVVSIIFQSRQYSPSILRPIHGGLKMESTLVISPSSSFKETSIGRSKKRV
jgi:hypothetical protein